MVVARGESRPQPQLLMNYMCLVGSVELLDASHCLK